MTGEPFVGLEAGSALQDHIDQHARDLRRALAFRIRMKSFEGCCQMVSEGVGAAIIPQAAAQALQEPVPFRTLALGDDWARRQLCLCFQHWHAVGADAKPADASRWRAPAS